MDLARYASLFMTESREHIAAIGRHLVRLQHDSRASEPVDEIFRSVHTIKGMAAAMGYEEVARLAHEMEDTLDDIRGGRKKLNESAVASLLRATDELDDAIETTDRATQAMVDKGPAGAPRAPGQIRVGLERLDRLMNLSGELSLAREQLARAASAIDHAPLHDALAATSRLIVEIRDEIRASRLVPVSQLFDRFPRLVRSAAEEAGKIVRFEVEGADISLDRSVVDEIAEPLVHVLRNAIDHGIETPQERMSAGKPAEGALVLSASRSRDAAMIRVADDGRGIDRVRVLERARAAGLAEAGATELSDEAVLQLIARPGFTTAERVTRLSGRGVGIDAVQTRLRSLGGSLAIRSTSGAGTEVVLRLPATLAVVPALMARVADETYAVPMTHVTHATELAPDELAGADEPPVLSLRGSKIPLLRFRELVRLPRGGGDVLRQIVVLEIGERRAALEVDEVMGQREILVKPFTPVRDAPRIFSGATVLDDGSPALILDVASLL